MALTDIKIRNAKPKDKPYKLADSDGMFLAIHPNGSKYWRLKYRYAGKEKLLACGVYERQLVELENAWAAANRKYSLASKTLSTDLRAQSKLLHRKIGSLEQELIGLNEKAVLITRINELSERKANLQKDIKLLEDFIEAKQSEQGKQISMAYKAISDNTCILLRQDLPRQDTFQVAQYVQFSFGDNKLSVNGESFFSASSMVMFRNSFMVSLLKTSLEISNFRYPRLLIMDSMEDKGIEAVRSHNFQMMLKAISDETQIEHQIIYATTMIAPELENTDYVVGDFYTHDKRTLSLPQR